MLGIFYRVSKIMAAKYMAGPYNTLNSCPKEPTNLVKSKILLVCLVWPTIKGSDNILWIKYGLHGHTPQSLLESVKIPAS